MGIKQVMFNGKFGVEQIYPNLAVLLHYPSLPPEQCEQIKVLSASSFQ